MISYSRLNARYGELADTTDGKVADGLIIRIYKDHRGERPSRRRCAEAMRHRGQDIRATSPSAHSTEARNSHMAAWINLTKGGVGMAHAGAI